MVEEAIMVDYTWQLAEMAAIAAKYIPQSMK